MKKVMVMLMAAAIGGVATADLTAWNISGGVATDDLGAAIEASSATAFSLSGDQVALFAGDTIQLSVVQSLTAIGGASAVGVGPVFLGGKYGTSFSDDGSAAGTATFLIVDRVVSSFAEIAADDYVGVASSTFTIEELWASQPDGTPNPTQTLTLGDVQTGVQVIPEPATLGLMGVAGLGMFLARRKARA